MASPFADLNISGLKDLFSWQGRTAPAPDPNTTAPRTDGVPIGGSGRAHFNGFIQFDELNARLVGIEGLRVFDNMYRTDPHIKRNVLAVWSPIQGASWEVVPHGGDRATDADRYAARLSEWALMSHMKPNFVEHLATVGPVLLRSGFAPFEQMWMTATWEGKKVVVPRKLDLRIPRTIWKWYQDDYGELTGVEQLLPNAASVEIPASELVYYRLQSEGDNWTGTSLLRQAYKPWFYKEHFEKIDAIGQERKAVGVPVVYPPQGADKITKGQVETVLANLHINQAGYIMMPGPKAGPNVDPNVGWTVEIVKFDSSSGETIADSIDSQKEAIAAAFLADFLELGHHQVGARATAEVQDDPFLTAVAALGDVVIAPANGLISRIAYLNVPGITGPPVLKMSMHDAASLSEIAEYVAKLIEREAMQADPALEDYLRERGDLPPADPKIRAEHEAAQKAGRERAIAGELAPGEAEHDEGGEGGKAIAPGKTRPQLEPGKADPDPKAHGGADPTKATNGPAKPAKQLDAAPAPEAVWYERLLEQGRLKQALDTARERMASSATPAAHHAASAIVTAVTHGIAPPMTPPAELVTAIEAELERLYHVGYDTVQIELSRQHDALGTRPTHRLQLAAGDGGAFGGLGARLARARERARLAAQNVINEVAAKVQSAAISAVKGPADLQKLADEAAEGQLRVEALNYASSSINDGRADAAAANIPDVVGGIYTSVLDNTTCGPCEAEDTGSVMQPEEAANAAPNPNCEGREWCRCMIVWILSEDPRALAAAGVDASEGE